jgi:hypothetical protein
MCATSNSLHKCNFWFWFSLFICFSNHSVFKFLYQYKLRQSFINILYTVFVLIKVWILGLLLHLLVYILIFLSFTAVQCQNHPAPYHTELVNVAKEYVYGNMLNYRCKEGYQAFGVLVSRCLATGRWSRVRGKCTRTWFST